MSHPLTRDHRRAIILLAAAAAASAAAGRMCDPMLPELARGFSALPGAVAKVVSGFMVAYGLAQILFGPLGDRIGKVRLIALTCLAATLGSLGAAVALDLDQLVAARILTGIAVAGIVPLSMAWIGDTVPYDLRQVTLARFLTGQVLGVIGGQFIGGVFTDTLGWRWAFVFLCLAYLLVGLALLAECRRNPVVRHAPDLAGGGGPARGLPAQLAAVLAIGWARTILAVVFLEGACVFGPMAMAPSYLHQRFGLSLLGAGALMGLFGVGGLGYILFSEIFVRRLGEVGLAVAGGALIAAAWTILAFADSWFYALAAAVLLGLGYYMIHNTLQTNATQMAPADRGTAVSLFACSFFLGQSSGVMLASFTLTRFGAVAGFGGGAAFILLLGACLAMLLRRR